MLGHCYSGKFSLGKTCFVQLEMYYLGTLGYYVHKHRDSAE